MIFSKFMPLCRNKGVWAQCLTPFELSSDPTPIYIMNQNLLMSYTSLSRSDSSSQPASPFSDSDIEVDRTNPQEFQSSQNNSDSDLDIDFQVPRQQLPTTEEFQYPHPTSPDYMVLNMNFNINAVENKRIPYPSDTEPRKVWTEVERVRASHAQVPLSKSDFLQRVSDINMQPENGTDTHLLRCQSSTTKMASKTQEATF
jgi:hypothetical protein